MKKFLRNVFLFSIIVLGFAVATCYQADGTTDPFYLRFTSSKKSSLIIGGSRAAQGIRADVLDSVLGENGIYNYAMTLANSPFGPVYVNSIKRKLDEEKKGGIFIVEVSPWSIASISPDPNDSASFREEKLFLAKTRCVNMNPNFEYLLESYKGRYFNLWFPKSSPLFLHDNGWLEVSIPMDSISIVKRTEGKIRNYREDQLPKYRVSEVRIASLERLIAFLKERGEVYLVRMPIVSELLKIEDSLMPDFNNLIGEMAREDAIPYFNFAANSVGFRFTDGNHLDKKSAKEFTEKLAVEIQLDLESRRN